MKPKIHACAHSPADTSRCYDISQTSEEIHDGDVLICNHTVSNAKDGATLTIYAVMFPAWPTALDYYGTDLQEDETFQLHWFSDIYTIEDGKYVASLDAANKHAEEN